MLLFDPVYNKLLHIKEFNPKKLYDNKISLANLFAVYIKCSRALSAYFYITAL